MDKKLFLLAIDQGTTNSRAIIFDQAGNALAHHELALAQHYPQDGWVEQDPLAMISQTVACCRAALQQAGLSARQIAAIGITNQRETTIVWEKQTGKPVYPAIVWQDRRTASICQRFAKHEPLFFEKTGLLLDPYFSATKLVWLLDHVSGARERAARGELLFGTVDSFLLWHFTRGQSHATDATNASRTLLFNIHTQQWDADILKLLNIPAAMLPCVMDNTANFGDMHEDFLGAKIAIAGMAGDQQAASIGQACFEPGMVKATFGTGAFMLLNSGNKVIRSRHRLLSTVLYRFQGHVTYGLEGSIFSAGATVKWFRDKLHLLQTAAESEELASRVDNTEGVYFLPAFTGLGAPYWKPDVRAAFTGITQAVRPEHLVRAGLESVAYQTRDLLDAMTHDSGCPISILRVDGGMTANNWFLQFVADMLEVVVNRPACIETTALGAAFLAGLQMGIYDSLEDIKKCWKMDTTFSPHMQTEKREKLYVGWKQLCRDMLK